MFSRTLHVLSPSGGYERLPFFAPFPKYNKCNWLAKWTSDNYKVVYFSSHLRSPIPRISWDAQFYNKKFSRIDWHQHRENRPAVIAGAVDQAKVFDIRNPEELDSIFASYHRRLFYSNGKMHRLDGPALINNPNEKCAFMWSVRGRYLPSLDDVEHLSFDIIVSALQNSSDAIERAMLVELAESNGIMDKKLVETLKLVQI